MFLRVGAECQELITVFHKETAQSPTQNVVVYGRFKNLLQPPTNPAGDVKTKSREMLRHSFAIAACVLGILFNIWVAVNNHAQAKTGVDFAQFYAAGQLVGTGQLYDVPAIERLERNHTAVVSLTARLPVVALGYKPFAQLSYSLAFELWLALSLASGWAAVWLWPDLNRWSGAIWFCWSVPSCIVLIFGQDVLLWFFFFSLGLMLLNKDRPYLAGIAFSMCICKFHLLLGLAIMLIAQKRWRTIASGCITTLLLLGFCFALEGQRWPSSYVAVTRLPEFTVAANKMPNIYGVAQRLPCPWVMEGISCLVVVAVLWSACRTAAIGLSGSLAAASGLLMAHHAYAYDCVLLLPLGAWIVSPRTAPRWLRMSALVILSPAFVSLIASNYSVIAQVLVLLFVMSALFWYSFAPLPSGSCST